MTANTDNYIVINRNTGQIICTGISDQVDNRPIIFEDEANNTIMILTLQDGESFTGEEDSTHYFDIKTNETKLKTEMNLIFSHPFVEPIEETIEDDEGNSILIQNYSNRINVDSGTTVVITNIPDEVKFVKIYDTRAEKESIIEVNKAIRITRDYDEITVVELESVKHFSKVFSIRFIAPDTEYPF